MNQTASQRLILNVQYALSTGNRWALFLTSILLMSALARMISNLLVTMVIFMHKALRESKDFLMIGFLSLFDFIVGVAHVFVFSFHYGVSLTRLQCFLTFRNIMSFLGSHGSQMMILMISIDRLLAVSFPFWYYNQRIPYAYRMFGIVVACSTGFGMVKMYYVVTKPDEIIFYCLTSRMYKFGNELQGVFTRVWLYSSFVVYILVIVVYRKKLLSGLNKEGASTTRKDWKEYKKRLRAITVTMGISALITLLMYAAPKTIWTWLRKSYPSLETYGWILIIPIEWSTVANFFLYIKRQPEFVKGLIALFKCQRLPDNLKVWFAPKPNSKAVRKEAWS